MSTVVGRASSADLRITTTAIDAMTILRRPARKTEANQGALQLYEDTSTQRIEMLLDAVAIDPNT